MEVSVRLVVPGEPRGTLERRPVRSMHDLEQVVLDGRASGVLEIHRPETRVPDPEAETKTTDRLVFGVLLGMTARATLDSDRILIVRAVRRGREERRVVRRQYLKI